MKPDIQVELLRARVAFEPRADSMRILCPFHDDSTPSCDVFLDNARFKCHGCGKGGDFISLLCKVEGKPRHVIEADLEARYGGDDKIVDADQVERCHRQIWAERSLLDALAHRCVDADTIRRFRLGADRGKITIPITSPSGEWVNLRRYAPGATDGPKMTNMRGRGKTPRIYPFDQLRFKRIVLCGGEIKALATLSVMNEHGIGAVAFCGGETNWSVALEDFFRSKQVWVCMDVDDPGRQASEFKCSRLAGISDWVGDLLLPLDVGEYPSGDMNDYLRVHGAVALLELLEKCPQYVPQAERKIAVQTEEMLAEPTPIMIHEVIEPERINTRVRCTVSVSAMDQSVYSVPKKVKVSCTRDQDFCAVCPVFTSRSAEFEIAPESSTLLAMMNTHRKNLREEMMTALKIPTQCAVADLEALANYKLIETRVQKSLDLSEQSSDKLMVPAIIVDDEVDLNETYEMTGRPVPHPKTQVATMIVSGARAVADALSTFDVGDTHDLEQFRPAEWTPESIEAKLSDIYNFYARNVTRIYDRPSLHKFVDLTFHSVLSMPVQGRFVKGWLETLVLGDSSQGKSDVFDHLCEFYQLGVKVDCANATTAGLLGGLEQIGGQWFAQWGIIPTHDRRIVGLEELKRLRPEVFTKLTDMRSSGKAQIPKIRKSQALARTRLVANSNPPKGNMASYAYGVKAITELISNPEDIRRFDACIVLSMDDISTDVPNSTRPQIEPLFDAATAKRLVLWAWTRTTDQVVIPDETMAAAIQAGRDLCETFSESIPLIDRGSVRFKVMRFACALACRTFSADDTGLNVVVMPCHVEWVRQLLVAEYSSKSNGYLAFSSYDRKCNEVVNVEKVRQELLRAPYPKHLAERMIAANDIEVQDFQDWCSWQRDECGIFVGMLVMNNALRRDGKAYRKTPALVELLRQIAAGPEDGEVPSHIVADTSTNGRY